MPTPDDLRKITSAPAGLEEFTHQFNTHVDLLKRTNFGGPAYVDGTGFYPRAVRSRAGVLDWYRLTANLDSGGTATAKKGVWDATTEVWEDTGAEETIADTTGRLWGLKGEWLLVRKSGGVLEAVAPGKEFHVATLTANLLTGSSAAATVAIDGVTANVTVYDHTGLGMAASKKIASGSAVRIWFHAGTWYADWTKCSNVVAQ